MPRSDAALRMLVQAQQRQQKATRRMAGGSIDGRSDQAAPRPERPRAQPYRPNIVRIPLSNKGPMAVGTSTPYPAPGDGHISTLVITATDVAAGSSTFRVRVNGVLAGNTITLPAGDAYVFGDVGWVNVAGGDLIDVECLTVGAGLGDLGGYVEVT